MTIDKKYVQYLTEIGFKKASKEEIEKYVPTDFEYIYSAAWYIFEGDLVLDNLEMKNLPLLIIGNLTVTEGTITTEDYNGLVVRGKTKAKSLITNGNTYLPNVEFLTAFITSGNGAPRIIKFAEGPFFYCDSDSAKIGDTQKITYFLELEDGWGGDYKGFFEMIVDAEKYFEDIQDWQCQSREEFHTKYSDNEYDSFEDYLFNEVGVNSTEIESAILDNRFEIKT